MAETIFYFEFLPPEPSLQETIESWGIPTQTVLMNPLDYRDLLIYGFVEEGMTETNAMKEADRRMAEMAEVQKRSEEKAVSQLLSQFSSSSCEL